MATYTHYLADGAGRPAYDAGRASLRILQAEPGAVGYGANAFQLGEGLSPAALYAAVSGGPPPAGGLSGWGTLYGEAPPYVLAGHPELGAGALYLDGAAGRAAALVFAEGWDPAGGFDWGEAAAPEKLGAGARRTLGAEVAAEAARLEAAAAAAGALEASAPGLAARCAGAGLPGGAGAPAAGAELLGGLQALGRAMALALEGYAAAGPALYAAGAPALLSGAAECAAARGELEAALTALGGAAEGGPVAHGLALGALLGALGAAGGRVVGWAALAGGAARAAAAGYSVPAELRRALRDSAAAEAELGVPWAPRAPLYLGRLETLAPGAGLGLYFGAYLHPAAPRWCLGAELERARGGDLLHYWFAAPLLYSRPACLQGGFDPAVLRGVRARLPPGDRWLFQALYARQLWGADPGFGALDPEGVGAAWEARLAELGRARAAGDAAALRAAYEGRVPGGGAGLDAEGAYAAAVEAERRAYHLRYVGSVWGRLLAESLCPPARGGFGEYLWRALYTLFCGEYQTVGTAYDGAPFSFGVETEGYADLLEPRHCEVALFRRVAPFPPAGERAAALAGLRRAWGALGALDAARLRGEPLPPLDPPVAAALAGGDRLALGWAVCAAELRAGGLRYFRRHPYEMPLEAELAGRPGGWGLLRGLLRQAAGPELPTLAQRYPVMSLALAREAAPASSGPPGDPAYGFPDVYGALAGRPTLLDPEGALLPALADPALPPTAEWGDHRAAAGLPPLPPPPLAAAERARRLLYAAGFMGLPPGSTPVLRWKAWYAALPLQPPAPGTAAGMAAVEADPAGVLGELRRYGWGLYERSALPAVQGAAAAFRGGFYAAALAPLLGGDPAGPALLLRGLLPVSAGVAYLPGGTGAPPVLAYPAGTALFVHLCLEAARRLGGSGPALEGALLGAERALGYAEALSPAAALLAAEVREGMAEIPEWRALAGLEERDPLAELEAAPSISAARRYLEWARARSERALFAAEEVPYTPGESPSMAAYARGPLLDWALGLPPGAELSLEYRERPQPWNGWRWSPPLRARGRLLRPGDPLSGTPPLLEPLPLRAAALLPRPGEAGGPYSPGANVAPATYHALRGPPLLGLPGPLPGTAAPPAGATDPPAGFLLVPGAPGGGHAALLWDVGYARYGGAGAPLMRVGTYPNGRGIRHVNSAPGVCTAYPLGLAAGETTELYVNARCVHVGGGGAIPLPQGPAVVALLTRGADGGVLDRSDAFLEESGALRLPGADVVLPRPDFLEFPVATLPGSGVAVTAPAGWSLGAMGVGLQPGAVSPLPGGGGFSVGDCARLEGWVGYLLLLGSSGAQRARAWRRVSRHPPQGTLSLQQAPGGRWVAALPPGAPPGLLWTYRADGRALGAPTYDTASPPFDGGSPRLLTAEGRPLGGEGAPPWRAEALLLEPDPAEVPALSFGGAPAGEIPGALVPEGGSLLPYGGGPAALLGLQAGEPCAALWRPDAPYTGDERWEVLRGRWDGRALLGTLGTLGPRGSGGPQARLVPDPRTGGLSLYGDSTRAAVLLGAVSRLQGGAEALGAEGYAGPRLYAAGWGELPPAAESFPAAHREYSAATLLPPAAGGPAPPPGEASPPPEGRLWVPLRSPDPAGSAREPLVLRGSALWRVMALDAPEVVGWAADLFGGATLGGEPLGVAQRHRGAAQLQLLRDGAYAGWAALAAGGGLSEAELQHLYGLDCAGAMRALLGGGYRYLPPLRAITEAVAWGAGAVFRAALPYAPPMTPAELRGVVLSAAAGLPLSAALPLAEAPAPEDPRAAAYAADLPLGAEARFEAEGELRAALRCLRSMNAQTLRLPAGVPPRAAWGAGLPRAPPLQRPAPLGGGGSQAGFWLRYAAAAGATAGWVSARLSLTINDGGRAPGYTDTGRPPYGGSAAAHFCGWSRAPPAAGGLLPGAEPGPAAELVLRLDGSSPAAVRWRSLLGAGSPWLSRALPPDPATLEPRAVLLPEPLLPVICEGAERFLDPAGMRPLDPLWLPRAPALAPALCASPRELADAYAGTLGALGAAGLGAPWRAPPGAAPPDLARMGTWELWCSSVRTGGAAGGAEHYPPRLPAWETPAWEEPPLLPAGAPPLLPPPPQPEGGAVTPGFASGELFRLREGELSVLGLTAPGGRLLLAPEPPAATAERYGAPAWSTAGGGSIAGVSAPAAPPSFPGGAPGPDSAAALYYAPDTVLFSGQGVVYWSYAADPAAPLYVLAGAAGSGGFELEARPAAPPALYPWGYATVPAAGIPGWQGPPGAEFYLPPPRAQNTGGGAGGYVDLPVAELQRLLAVLAPASPGMTGNVSFGALTLGASLNPAVLYYAPDGGSALYPRWTGEGPYTARYAEAWTYRLRAQLPASWALTSDAGAAVPMRVLEDFQYLPLPSAAYAHQSPPRGPYAPGLYPPAGPPLAPFNVGGRPNVAYAPLPDPFPGAAAAGPAGLPGFAHYTLLRARALPGSGRTELLTATFGGGGRHRGLVARTAAPYPLRSAAALAPQGLSWGRVTLRETRPEPPQTAAPQAALGAATPRGLLGDCAAATEHRLGPWCETAESLSWAEQFWGRPPTALPGRYDFLPGALPPPRRWVVLGYDYYGVPDEGAEALRLPLARADLGALAGEATVGDTGPLEFESRAPAYPGSAVTLRSRYRPLSLWLAPAAGAPPEGRPPAAGPPRLGYPFAVIAGGGAAVRGTELLPDEAARARCAPPAAMYTRGSVWGGRDERGAPLPLPEGWAPPAAGDADSRDLSAAGGLAPEGGALLPEWRGADPSALERYADRKLVYCLNRVVSYDPARGTYALEVPVPCATNRLSPLPGGGWRLTEGLREVREIHASKLAGVWPGAPRFYGAPGGAPMRARAPGGQRVEVCDPPASWCAREPPTLRPRPGCGLVTAVLPPGTVPGWSEWSLAPPAGPLADIPLPMGEVFCAAAEGSAIPRGALFSLSADPHRPLRLELPQGRAARVALGISAPAAEDPPALAAALAALGPAAPLALGALGAAAWSPDPPLLWGADPLGEPRYWTLAAPGRPRELPACAAPWRPPAPGEPGLPYAAAFLGAESWLLAPRPARRAAPFPFGSSGAGGPCIAPGPAPGTWAFSEPGEPPLPVALDPGPGWALVSGPPAEGEVGWDPAGFFFGGGPPGAEAPLRCEPPPGVAWLADPALGADGLYLFPPGAAALPAGLRPGRVYAVRGGSARDVTPELRPWDPAEESSAALGWGVPRRAARSLGGYLEGEVYAPAPPRRLPLAAPPALGTAVLRAESAWGLGQMRARGLWADPRMAAACARTTAVPLQLAGPLGDPEGHWGARMGAGCGGGHPYYSLGHLRCLAADVALRPGAGAVVAPAAAPPSVAEPWDEQVMRAVRECSYLRFAALVAGREERFRSRFVGAHEQALRPEPRPGGGWGAPGVAALRAEASGAGGFGRAWAWGYSVTAAVHRLAAEDPPAPDAERRALELLQIWGAYLELAAEVPAADVAYTLSLAANVAHPLGPAGAGRSLLGVPAPPALRIAEYTPLPGGPPDELARSLLASMERAAFGAAADALDDLPPPPPGPPALPPAAPGAPAFRGRLTYAYAPLAAALSPYPAARFTPLPGAPALQLGAPGGPTEEVDPAGAGLPYVVAADAAACYRRALRSAGYHARALPRLGVLYAAGGRPSSAPAPGGGAAHAYDWPPEGERAPFCDFAWPAGSDPAGPPTYMGSPACGHRGSSLYREVPDPAGADLPPQLAPAAAAQRRAECDAALAALSAAAAAQLAALAGRPSPYDAEAAQRCAERTPAALASAAAQLAAQSAIPGVGEDAAALALYGSEELSRAQGLGPYLEAAATLSEGLSSAPGDLYWTQAALIRETAALASAAAAVFGGVPPYGGNPPLGLPPAPAALLSTPGGASLSTTADGLLLTLPGGASSAAVGLGEILGICGSRVSTAAGEANLLGAIPPEHLHLHDPALDTTAPLRARLADHGLLLLRLDAEEVVASWSPANLAPFAALHPCIGSYRAPACNAADVHAALRGYAAWLQARDPETLRLLPPGGELCSTRAPSVAALGSVPAPRPPPLL